MRVNNKNLLSNRNAFLLVLLHFILQYEVTHGRPISKLFANTLQEVTIYGDFILNYFWIASTLALIAIYRNKFNFYSILMIIYIIVMGWLNLVVISMAVD